MCDSSFNSTPLYIKQKGPYIVYNCPIDNDFVNNINSYQYFPIFIFNMQD